MLQYEYGNRLFACLRLLLDLFSIHIPLLYISIQQFYDLEKLKTNEMNIYKKFEMSLQKDFGMLWSQMEE